MEKAPPPSRPVGPAGVRVLRGTGHALLSQFAVLAANLAVTPRLVSALTVEGYALYTLMWTVTGYLTLLNLGSVAGIQRYTSLLRGRGEVEKLGRILRATLAFQLVAGLAGGAATWAGRGWIARHLLPSFGPVQAVAPEVLGWVAFGLPGYFALLFGVNVLYGQGRLGWYSLFQALLSLAVSVAAWCLLVRGFWLADIACAFAVAHAGLAAWALWLVRDPLLAGSGLSEADDAAGFMRFALKSFSSQCLWMVKFQGDRLLIGPLLPLAQMGYYNLASSQAQKFNAVYGSVATAAMPVLTELHGGGEHERLRRVYLKASELTLFLVVPVTVLSAMLVPQFLTLWLGPDFSRHCTWPFRLLVAANLVYVGTYLPNVVAVGHGAPQWLGYTMAAEVALLALSWPVLIPRWGILGAASGLAGASLACVPIFVARVHRSMLGVGWREFLVESCGRPALSGLALTGGLLIARGWVGGWISLVAVASASLALYLGFGYWSLDAEARGMAQAWLERRGRAPGPD